MIPSLLREKTSNSDPQQCQLSYLAKMTDNFGYIADPLNAAADALSHPPAKDEDADEVCCVELTLQKLSFLLSSFCLQL